MTTKRSTPFSHSGLEMDWFPPCFPSIEEYERWMEAVLASLVIEDRPDDYCTDCLPAYQDKMMDLGRCLHPETLFYERMADDGTGTIVGYRNPPRLGKNLRAIA